MGRGVAREALDRRRRVEQLSNLRIVVVRKPELRDLLERLRDRETARSGRDELGDAIDVGERDAERAARIADRRARRHRPERDDLRDPVLAVLVDDVLDDFIAPLDAKVGIDIRHRDAFGVQEALEDQPELDRVEIGDAQAVRDHRADRRAAAGADRDVAVTGVLDEVPHDQEIRREPHRVDDAEFVFHPLAQGGVGRRAFDPVAREQPLLADAAEIVLGGRLLGRFGLGHRIVGQVEHFVRDLDVDALDDLERVVARLRDVGEQLAHLFRRLHVELVGEELHPARVLHGLPSADAEQHVVGLRVALGQVVRVVGRDQRVIQLPRDLDQSLVDDVFFRHPVPHDLDVEPVAEDLAEDLRVLFRRLVVVLEQRRRDQRGHAARKDDQTLVVLREQIEVDPRLVVVPLEEALGDQRGQVLVADVAGGEQRDVGLVADRPVEAPARRDVRLAADDRREALLLRGIVELDRAEHHAVVGQRNPRRAFVRRLATECVDATRAVEQRVLGMHVQMDERAQRKINLRRENGRGVRSLT